MPFKKYCAKCGKSFMGNPGDNLCSACKFELSMSQKNNSAENFGTTIKNFERFPHPCEKCGTIIEKGVYCEKCLTILRNQSRKAGEEREFKKQLLLEIEAQKKNSSVILIVDEDVDFAEKTQDILSEKLISHTVLIANDLEHTINLIHRLKVKLVFLSDGLSEKFNGLEILKKIREDKVVRDLPVIIMTEDEDENKKIAAKNLDAIDFMKKPLETEKLFAEIYKVLLSGVQFKDSMSKVLLIDDREDDAEIEKNILEENFHCTVFTADGGIDGLGILQTVEKIDLIFISFKMSFMNGLRTLELIRQNEFFKGIPAIFMISSEDPETVRKVRKSSAVGYVNKPEISSEYFDFIKKFLNKEKKS